MDFVRRALPRWTVGAKREASAREQLKFQQRSRRALRCTVLRTLLPEDYRGFSCQLAGNPLYQWFCHIDALDLVRVPSKSEVQRYADWLPAEQMRELIEGLLQGALHKPRKLGLKEPLDLEACFPDSTCLEANIHLPTDWVLLRDGVRTLMKATRLIRQAGLRGRMEPPEEFLRRMNRLNIQMSQQGRRPGRKQERKRVLGAIKKLVRVVRAQTEGRIGILKNGFLGRPLRAKGFVHRQLALAWGVLTPDLWRLARLRRIQKKTQAKPLPLRQAA
jgi:hypothetical protein